MLATAYTSLDAQPEDPDLTIEEAGQLLIGTDGWPIEWPFTNDEEGHLRDTTLPFPHMFVINLATMEIVSARDNVFGSNGYDDVQDLIDTISAF